MYSPISNKARVEVLWLPEFFIAQASGKPFASSAFHGNKTEPAMRLMQIFRSLMRAPRFSISVMLTLGLGLAVTLLMWAVLWHAVLEPLPYRDAGALSVLSAERDGQDRKSVV